MNIKIISVATYEGPDRRQEDQGSFRAHFTIFYTFIRKHSECEDKRAKYDSEIKIELKALNTAVNLVSRMYKHDSQKIDEILAAVKA